MIIPISFGLLAASFITFVITFHYRWCVLSELEEKKINLEYGKNEVFTINKLFKSLEKMGEAHGKLKEQYSELQQLAEWRHKKRFNKEFDKYLAPYKDEIEVLKGRIENLKKKFGEVK